MCVSDVVMGEREGARVKGKEKERRGNKEREKGKERERKGIKKQGA